MNGLDDFLNDERSIRSFIECKYTDSISNLTILFAIL